MNQSPSIYALSHPETGEIRYIGQAVNPRKRFNLHMFGAQHGKTFPVYDWIRSLLDKDLEPTFEILEETSLEEMDAAEISWIALCRNHGCNLLNVTDGGSVPMRGRKFTEEHRRKISEAHKGRKWTDEQRQRASERLKGRKLSPETCAKLSEIRKGKKRGPLGPYGPMGEETKRKLSEAMTGRKLSPEHCKLMSEQRVGVPHPHIGHHVKRNRKPVLEDIEKQILSEKSPMVANPAGLALGDRDGQEVTA
jgi:hypothetical protein